MTGTVTVGYGSLPMTKRCVPNVDRDACGPESRRAVSQTVNDGLANREVSSRRLPDGASREDTRKEALDLIRLKSQARLRINGILNCLQSNRPRISKACNQVLVSHGQ